MPSSTTRFAGNPKYAVAGRALRERNANSHFLHRAIFEVPVVSKASKISGLAMWLVPMSPKTTPMAPQ